MNREVHVRFWESARVKLPRATHLTTDLSEEKNAISEGNRNILARLEPADADIDLVGGSLQGSAPCVLTARRKTISWD